MSAIAAPNVAANRQKLVDTNMQRKPDYWIVAAVIGLCLIGLVMVYSATYAEASADGADPAELVRSQLQNMLLGFVLMAVCAIVPYNRWRRFSVPLMAVTLLALVLVLFAPEGIARTVNGATRWLRFPIQWQPSEVTKLVLVLYVADWLSQKGKRVGNLTYGLIPFGIVMGIIAFLVMKEPDMGTTMVICSIGVMMFFVAGAHMVQFLGSMGLASLVFYVLMTAESYRASRFASFKDPWADPTGAGWHSTQALMAIGSGGWLGQGLGAGRQKFGWLPEQYTDTIFAVLGQEWGLLGALVLIGLFTLLVVRGYRAALRAPDSYGTLLAIGFTTWLGFQALINIAAVSNAIPFTGLTLPFISYGGSSMLVTLAGVGMLINVSRYSRVPVAVTEPAAPKTEPTPASRNLRRPAGPRFAGTRRARPQVAFSTGPATNLAETVRSTVTRTWQRTRQRQGTGRPRPGV